jgi:hypothetical protein
VAKLTLIDTKCWRCGHKKYDVFVVLGQPYPDCEKCGGECERLYEAGSTAGVVGDECDVWIRHALCNADGSPRRYTSRQEIAREAAKRGWTNHVEHVAVESDKNKHTQRFTQAQVQTEEERIAHLRRLFPEDFAKLGQ